MINNSNKNRSGKEGLEALLSGFLGNKIEISKENSDKINGIIESLSEEDINKIKKLAMSGQLQKVASTIKDKK